MGSWKTDPILLLAFCSNFMSILHRLWVISVFLQNRKWRHNDSRMKTASGEVKRWVFWTADPDLLLAFFGDFSSISHRSRFISDFISTWNDQHHDFRYKVKLDINCLFWINVPSRTSIVDFLYLLLFRCSSLFYFKGEFASEPNTRGVFCSYALKLDLVSTRSKKASCP